MTHLGEHHRRQPLIQVSLSDEADAVTEVGTADTQPLTTTMTTFYNATWRPS